MSGVLNLLLSERFDRIEVRGLPSRIVSKGNADSGGRQEPAELADMDKGAGQDGQLSEKTTPVIVPADRSSRTPGPW